MSDRIEFGSDGREQDRQAAYLKDLDLARHYVHKELAVLGLEEGMRVLDAGCGRGAMTRRFAELVGNSGRAIGIDQNARFLELATQDAQGDPTRSIFVKGDVGSLRFAENRFDRVFVERVLSHHPDPLAAITEFHRVLKPGGKLVVLDISATSLDVDHRDQEFTRQLLAEFANAFKSGSVGIQLGRLLRASGFEDVESTPIIDRHSFASSRAKHYGTLRSLVEQGKLSVGGQQLDMAQLENWWQHLEQLEAQGDFAVTINLYLASGVKPEKS